MKVEELIQRCKEARYVTLVMKGAIRPSQTRKRFMGRKGPMGEIVCEYEDNRTMVAFKSEEVLRFIIKELLLHENSFYQEVEEWK